MTIGEEVRAIHKRLQELLGKNHPDCILLGATLTCRNCNLSRFKGKVDGVPDVWYCTQWNANIPPEALGAGCDCWKNNVGVGHN
jgi:hypothetical protein